MLLEAELMAELKHLGIVIVILAVITGLVVFVSRQPGGWIETAGGSICSWRIGGNATAGHALKLDCKCRDEQNNEIPYNCQYAGKPQETCKQTFHLRVLEFYHEMIDAVKG